MKNAFRFRLYPSSRQAGEMLRALEASRRLWNDALAHRKARWEDGRQLKSYNLQASILTSEREQDTLLGGLYSQVGQDVLRRLDRAFKSFFAQRARYPRFKKFGQSGSFIYPQAYNGSVRPDEVRMRLYLSKIGNVKAVFHRSLPKDSRLKTCTVVREPDGRWFASLVFDETVPLQNLDDDVTTIHKTPIGIDLGLLSLITTSDGETVEHPRFLRKAETRLKHLQRTLSRKKKGSKNRFKARQRVASQHAKVRRQRLDFHKLSTRLIREHGFVAFEDLRVRNMVRNPRLAKSIHDAAWSQLVALTEYRALRTGSRAVRVPAAYSSQECFYCGTLNKVALDVRKFVCVGCGRTLERDPNAARVVLKRGLAIAGLAAPMVGLDTPELKPAEMGPLLVSPTRGVSPVDGAGTIRAETGAGTPALAAGGCHIRTRTET
jgi:putative transposase